MSLVPTLEPMSAEQSVVLGEFARACKSAARSVSLYPGTHPAIQTSLSRVTAAAGRLIPLTDITLTVHPDALVIDGRTPARPDPAIGELAGLLHERLVGILRMERAADALDWHAFLLLLGRAPDELIAEGGIAKAWAATGGTHFDISEIDYADVLRERAGGRQGAEWDRIISHCLQGDATTLGGPEMSGLLDATGDSSRFNELLDRLQTTDMPGGETVEARAAALLEMIRMLVQAASSKRDAAEAEESTLQMVADAVPRLTPEMVLAMLQAARSGGAERSKIAAGIMDRMSDRTIASFVAESVVAERGASQRLAQAFEALVPDGTKKERLLEVAKSEAAQSLLGREAGFEKMWTSTASMLSTYSDEGFVSTEYARELSTARVHAIDVDQVSDDPPERVQGWMSTVTTPALVQLDLSLLLDLLTIEAEPDEWRGLARITASEVERLVQASMIAEAQQLTEAIVRDLGPEGRSDLREAALSAVEALVSGPLVRHQQPRYSC